MSDSSFQILADMLTQGASEEDVARALLEMTLDAAPPDVAEAIRVCALLAWFDAELLAYLLETAETDAETLLAQVTAFSFVQPRDAGGYVYHEATRARLLDAWQTPERRERFRALAERLAARYLTLAEKHVPPLKGPRYVEALAVLDAAYPNIQAAWENAVSVELWDLIPSFAYILADYQDQRGLWQQELAYGSTGIKACENLGDEQRLADMQIIVGNAYAQLPTGDRAANLARAIACYEEALRFYTPETAPLAYAMTQNNLGNAYRNLPTGDRAAQDNRAANLARAIACYEAALRFLTPEAAPLAYATTQNNLGLAYADLSTGDRVDQDDRGANLARAIACYEAALRFHTPEAAPLNYATTQNNLGNAYADLPTGDRAANLARAIACYEAALRFLTPEAAPLAYAMTQNNLGEAYRNLPTGDRAANLARAIACYEAALRFRTSEAAPLQYATTQFNLGQTYYELGQLEQAAKAYRRALKITPEQGNRQATLGAVLRKLGREEEAAVHLARARELLPADDHYNLACLEAIAGNADAALDHLERAIAWDATLRDWAARDPDLEPLHGNPRFEAIIRMRE